MKNFGNCIASRVHCIPQCLFRVFIRNAAIIRIDSPLVAIVMPENGGGGGGKLCALFSGIPPMRPYLDYEKRLFSRNNIKKYAKK